jgi:hypothetical protein
MKRRLRGWMGRGWIVGFIGGLLLVWVGIPVMALSVSTGEDGIQAQILHAPPYNLTGRKIAIGQIEIGRPARFGLDKAGATNRAVRPNRLFFRDSQAEADTLVDRHAASVASVMISNDKTLRGVAPDAVLYSAAVGTDSRSEQAEECLALQTLAQQNGGDLRAINYSFGESLDRDPRPNPVLDGNALLTQCVDWSARVHDVLHVVAGNQGAGGFPIPTDTFNGIVIANSMQVNGRFTKVDFSSLGSEPTLVFGRDPSTESNVGARRSVGLVAPGSNLETITPNGRVSAPVSGTSFAAPHVAATVALLQEFGDRSIREALAVSSHRNNTHWSLDARHQLVTKAVLMNSADKIEDTGDGRHLGMTRTLRNQRNRTWLESDAYHSTELSLDADMGTGHLNAFRAYQQFSSGQWRSGRIPAIGWDYRTVSVTHLPDADLDLNNDLYAAPFRDYIFDAPLQKDNFLSATLVWDRVVDLQDRNRNGQYDIGEQFVDRGLNDLNLYLMPVLEPDTANAIWRSDSTVDSVEHLFYQIPQTGRYKLRVEFSDRVNEPIQSYALAWWGAE